MFGNKLIGSHFSISSQQQHLFLLGWVCTEDKIPSDLDWALLRGGCFLCERFCFGPLKREVLHLRHETKPCFCFLKFWASWGKIRDVWCADCQMLRTMTTLSGMGGDFGSWRGFRHTLTQLWVSFKPQKACLFFKTILYINEDLGCQPYSPGVSPTGVSKIYFWVDIVRIATLIGILENCTNNRGERGSLQTICNYSFPHCFDVSFKLCK